MKKRKALFTTTALLIAIAGIFGYYAWKSWIERGLLDRWINRELRTLYEQKIKPELPPLIEKVEWEAGWSDYVNGKIKRLRVEARVGANRITLEGPLDLDLTLLKDFNLTEILKGKLPGAVTATYKPTLKIIPLSGAAEDSFDPLDLKLSGTVAKNFEKLEAFSLESEVKNWSARAVGLSVKDLHLHLKWPEVSPPNTVDNPTLPPTAYAVGDFAWSAAHWEDSKTQSQAEIKAIKISGRVPLTLQPLALSGEANLSWVLVGAEALLGELYLDLPLAMFPGTLTASLQGMPPLPQKVALKIGKKRSAEGHLSFTPRWDSNPSKLALRQLNVRWKSPLLPIAQTLDLVFKSLGKSTPEDVQILGGHFQTHGQTDIDLNSLNRPKLFKGNLSVQDLGFTLKNAPTGLRGLFLEIPFDLDQTFTANIKIDQIAVKKLVAALPLTPIKMNLTYPNLKLIYELEKSTPLQFGPIRTELGPTKGNVSSEGIDTTSSFKLFPLNPMELIPYLCLSRSQADLIPPSSLEANLSRIEIFKKGEEESLETQGKARLSLFEGYAELSDLSIYDFLKSVPQTDFDLYWKDIQMGKIGDWLNFGTMDGTFNGYFNNATFQSVLPTQYDLRIEARPAHSSKIVFSPTAMKNLVRLFAGPDLDIRLPGIANFFAFGWVSRLFGGYNVNYAGIEAYSTDGVILVKTLDSEEVLEKEQGKHFIIYGPRFKMPLRSPHYPVVLDAPAMGNFVHFVLNQIENIKEAKKAEPPDPKENENEDIGPCMPKEFLQ